MTRHLLFNPRRSSTELLTATLVARQPVLERLERDLLADQATGTARHWTLLGPRGIGKSHLTELLGRRMRDQHGWTVARLPEEHYQVHSLTDLAVQILRHCAGDKAIPRSVPFEDRLDYALARLRELPGPILVIVENLGVLLGQKIRARTDQQRLRSILMHDPPFVLVSTALHTIPETVRADAPFHDFFQAIPLRDLTREEVHELVDRRLAWEGADALGLAEREIHARINAIFHLSGGNPRLAVALYGVLTRGVGHSLYDDLLQLLDEVTPYYQARLADLAPQQQQVLVALGIGPGSATPSEVAERCGMSTNQITALLKKLEDARLAHPAGRPADKRKRYWEIADRLFRVWLQMREDPDGGRIRWLVEFYRSVYAVDEDAGVAHLVRLLDVLAGDVGPGARSDALLDLEHLAAALDPDLTELVALSDALFAERAGDRARIAEQEAGTAAQRMLRMWRLASELDEGGGEALEQLRAELERGNPAAAVALAFKGPREDAVAVLKEMADQDVNLSDGPILLRLGMRAVLWKEVELGSFFARKLHEHRGPTPVLPALLIAVALAAGDADGAERARDWLDPGDRAPLFDHVLSAERSAATAVLATVGATASTLGMARALDRFASRTPPKWRPALLDAYRWLVEHGQLETLPHWEHALVVDGAEDPEAALAGLHPEERDAVRLVLRLT